MSRRSLGVIAAPCPDQRVRERLLEHCAITAARGTTEDVMVVELQPIVALPHGLFVKAMFGYAALIRALFSTAGKTSSLIQILVDCWPPH
jgi:hypothetical protein